MVYESYICSLVIVMWWLRIYKFHDFSINTSTTDSTPLSHPTLSPAPQLWLCEHINLRTHNVELFLDRWNSNKECVKCKLIYYIDICVYYFVGFFITRSCCTIYDSMFDLCAIKSICLIMSSYFITSCLWFNAWNNVAVLLIINQRW